MDDKNSEKKQPKTLMQFRERQKELKRRNEEKRNNNIFSEDKELNKDDSYSEYNKKSISISLIQDSIFLSSKIISSSEDKSDVSSKFTKFFKQQQELLSIAIDKLNININNKKEKELISDLNKSITEIIYINRDINYDKLKYNFIELCNQINSNKDFIYSNREMSSLLYIDARVSTFNASMKIWNGISQYPFTKNIDNTSSKIFSFVINLSRDIAVNWQENLNNIERQHLYVSMVTIISDIAIKCWERFSINNLDNSFSTIDKRRLDLEKKIIDTIEPSVVGIAKSNDFSNIVVNKVIEETEKYSQDYYHMERKSLNIVRKTIFNQISFNVYQYIKDNKSESINKIKKDDDYLEFISDKIEQIIEHTPPKVINNIDEYHEELKDLVIQAWGAAQGIYKFRRDQ